MDEPLTDSWTGPQSSTVAWLCAEAHVAYEVWRAAPETSMVEWRNAKGWDVRVVDQLSRSIRINAKRSWRKGLPNGFVAYGGPIDPSPAHVDFFALVLLEDEDVVVRWGSSPDSGVALRAGARPTATYYVPVQTISEHARWDRGSNQRAVIAQSVIETFTLPPTGITNDRY